MLGRKTVRHKERGSAGGFSERETLQTQSYFSVIHAKRAQMCARLC